MSYAPTSRFRTRLGEPITAGRRYAVTADGRPDINAPHLLFLAPEHQWRIQWAPEEAATVQLTREDHDGWTPVRLAPLGLLGLAVHAVRGQFRLVSATEFQVAAAEILGQMSRQHPATQATVVIPEGFTLHTVAPSMVAGSVEAHARHLADPEPGHRHSGMTAVTSRDRTSGAAAAARLTTCGTSPADDPRPRAPEGPA